MGNKRPEGVRMDKSDPSLAEVYDQGSYSPHASGCPPRPGPIPMEQGDTL
jgi:hypothetical protein